MKACLLFLLTFVALSLLLVSCKDEPEPFIPAPPQWTTVPEYDFPIYIAKRGGVVTTSLETFEVTGFLEVGDPAAYNDSLEWKVLPYNRLNAIKPLPVSALQLQTPKTPGGTK